MSDASKPDDGKPAPKTPLRDERGRLLKGTPTANKAGRKYGQKNRRTLVENMLLSKEPELTAHLVNWVAQGNSAAISIVFRYLLPQMRSRPLNIDLPQIRSAAELPDAINHILSAMGEGKLSMAEGVTAINVYDTLAKAYSIADFEKRIQALEKAGDGGSDDVIL